jgi:hypothetical protein
MCATELGHADRPSQAAFPVLLEDKKSALESEFMRTWRAVRTARRNGDTEAETAARRDVDAAKHALGERGPAWRTNGDADLDLHPVNNTSYADWFATLKAHCRSRGAS